LLFFLEILNNNNKYMKFFQLDPRQSNEDQPQVDLGIEDTIGVSDVNIDHHGPEDTVETPSACEQVFAMTPLLVAETIATVRPDADSVTAMAIYKSRREHDGATSQLNDKLVWQIGTMDRFGPRAAEGFDGDERNEDQKISIAIAKIASNFRKSMDERVELVQQILEGNIDDDLSQELEGLVQQRDREFVDALAASEIEEVIPGHLAFVKSTHRFATQIGYAAASTLVAFNPEMPVMETNIELGRYQATGETYRKFTICRYDSHVRTDITAVLAELNELESGWGGRGDIIGSPQNRSSELSEEQVLSIVEKHVQLGKIRHELKTYGELNHFRGLVGRMQRGLDPAGMIAVEETLGKLEEIGNALGVDLMEFVKLTNALHVGAIWDYAQDFVLGTNKELQLWMVTGEACVSGKEKEGDLSPEEFMVDVKRVHGLLDEAVADPQAFVKRSQEELVLRASEKFQLKDGVPFSEVDDGFLAAAICGYQAAVVLDKDGLLFVGAANLDYAYLLGAGLTETTRFDERRGVDQVFWVDAEGNDVVKVLYTGFAIVFGGREDVAQTLARTAMDQ
jgi:hypothetical protein